MILGFPKINRTTFSRCLDQLTYKSKETKLYILEKSLNFVGSKHQELKTFLYESNFIDIFVSFCDTCYRNNHTSLYDIGIAIDILTDLVFDFVILSKYYLECVSTIRDLWRYYEEYHIWNSSYSSKCQKNFSGSSTYMQMQAAFIFRKHLFKLEKLYAHKYLLMNIQNISVSNCTKSICDCSDPKRRMHKSKVGTELETNSSM